MIGRVNTGGGKGAALTVTAPAGATVTASKDGKTLTRVAGADGIVIFRGLETGTWTLSITDGEQEAQKTVTVIADYSTSITFFAATINVTYPAGSICTATDGVTTLSSPDTSGTWACVVPNAGAWTVSAETGRTETIIITDDGQVVYVNLINLYSIGNVHSDITGGWSNDGYRHAVSTSYTMRGPEFGNSGMKLYVPSANYSAVAGTGIKVDITNAREILVNVSGLDGTMLVIVNGSKAVWDTDMVAQLAIRKNGLHALDVSDLSGSYYIALVILGNSGHAVQSSTVSEVYLK